MSLLMSFTFTALVVICLLAKSCAVTEYGVLLRQHLVFHQPTPSLRLLSVNCGCEEAGETDELLQAWSGLSTREHRLVVDEAACTIEWSSAVGSRAHQTCQARRVQLKRLPEYLEQAKAQGGWCLNGVIAMVNTTDHAADLCQLLWPALCPAGLITFAGLGSSLCPSDIAAYGEGLEGGPQCVLQKHVTSAAAYNSSLLKPSRALHGSAEGVPVQQPQHPSVKIVQAPGLAEAPAASSSAQQKQPANRTRQLQEEVSTWQQPLRPPDNIHAFEPDVTVRHVADIPTVDCDSSTYSFWAWTSTREPSGSEHHTPTSGRQLFGSAYAQRWIWQRQNPVDCQSAKFLVFYPPAHGLGSTIHIMGAVMGVALSLGRIFIQGVTEGYVWTEGDWCEGLRAFDLCYFEHFSSCSFEDAQRAGEWNDDRLFQINRLPSDRFNAQHCNPPTQHGVDQSHLRTVECRDWVTCVFDGGKGLPPELAELLLPYSHIPEQHWYYWWRAQAAAYMVRPNPRTLAELRRRRARLFGGREIAPGTISVHVRHGDKFNEAKLVPDHEYLATAEQLLALAHNGSLRREIYLSTEDPATVEFFRQADTWEVSYTEVSRAYSHGESPHAFARRIGPSEEMLNSLLSLQLAIECDAWVGTMSSNWCRLVDELRLTVRCKAGGLFLDPQLGQVPEHYRWRRSARRALQDGQPP